MTVVKQRGELLLGTREEVEQHIARLVHEAGRARGVLSFTDPEPWPGMPGKVYVRVTVVRPMQRPAPAARRRSLVPWLVGVLVLLVVLLAAAGYLLVEELNRAAAGGKGSGVVLVLLVVLVAIVAAGVRLSARRRSSSTTTTQVTYTRTRTRTR